MENVIDPILQQVVYKGKIFIVTQQMVDLGIDKKLFEWACRSPGVRIIIVDKVVKKVLLTKEYRKELDKYDIRVPGGKVFGTVSEYLEAVKVGKDMFTETQRAAKAEAHEEAGVQIKNLELLYLSKAGSSVEWDLYYYVAEIAGEIDINPDSGEYITTGWYTYEEALQLCINGEMKEDRSVGVLMRFLLRNVE